MSYFNQIIQRSSIPNTTEMLSPGISPHHEVGPEIDDPFQIAPERIPPVTQDAPTPLTPPNLSDPISFSSDQFIVPEIKPESIPETQNDFYPRIISETTIIEEKQKESFIISEPQNNVDAASKAKTNTIRESIILEKSKSQNSDKVLNEKLVLKKPTQEIPPIRPEDFKSVVKSSIVEPVPTKEKNNKEETSNSLVKQKKQLFPPEKFLKKEEVKTVMKPKSRERITEIPKKKTTEKKLSIGKITVEMVAKENNRPAPVRTVYRTRRIGGSTTSGSFHKFRYSLRFGLGQL